MSEAVVVQVFVEQFSNLNQAAAMAVDPDCDENPKVSPELTRGISHGTHPS